MGRSLLLSILVWLSSALTLWGQVGAVQVRLEGESMVDHPRFPLLTLGGKLQRRLDSLPSTPRGVHAGV